MMIVEKITSFLKKAIHQWQEHLHTVYVICIIIGWLISGHYSSDDFKAKAALFAILGYFLVLLIFLLYFVNSYSRKARYAEATSCIHQVIHEIRDTGSYLKFCMAEEEKYELSEFKNRITRILDSVSRAFSIVSATNCRASIKVLGGKDNSYLKTLARDSASSQSCREKDRDEGEKHKVVRNHDYNLIFNNGKNYFHSGDISAIDGYQNTSKSDYKGIFPYKSVLVLPIRSANLQKENSDEDKYRYHGLLTVDSNTHNAFIVSYDIDLGATIADALYSLLDLWAHVHKNFNQPHK